MVIWLQFLLVASQLLIKLDNVALLCANVAFLAPKVHDRLPRGHAAQLRAKLIISSGRRNRVLHKLGKLGFRCVVEEVCLRNVLGAGEVQIRNLLLQRVAITFLGANALQSGVAHDG